MNPNVFIMLRLGTTGLATNVARVRSCSRVHSKMLFEIVRTVEGLVAYATCVGLVFLVLLHVTQAVIFANELRAAVVAGVGPDVPVAVHVRRVVAVSIKGSAALVALERLGATRCMRPLMQL